MGTHEDDETTGAEAGAEPEREQPAAATDSDQTDAHAATPAGESVSGEPAEAPAPEQRAHHKPDEPDERGQQTLATDGGMSAPLVPGAWQQSAAARAALHRRRILRVRRRTRALQAAQSLSITRAAILVMSLLGVVSILMSATSALAAAAYYQGESAPIAGLAHTIAARNSVRIYDRNGVLLYQFNQDGAQHTIPLAQIPVTVVNATVAIEDHDFWTNNGIDFVSIVRAAEQDLASGRIEQGGSTITQQLIKANILGSEVTFTRKLEEAILAVGITETGAYSKSQILQMYLNSIPYSPMAYGIDAAAQEYFGYQDDPATGMTAAQHLDLAQAAMLAGVPQNPNANDPLLHPQAALTRMQEVLRAMVQYGYITPAQANAAWAEAHQPDFFHPGTAALNLAPQFVYLVVNQLEQMIDLGQLHDLARSGLNVYTTLDYALQQHTMQAIHEHLYGNDQTDFAVPTYIRNDNVTNAAALLVSQQTGAIRVYVGSANYGNAAENGDFDVISQGYRSPGSSFKPIVYATAFEKGWFPATTVGDIPTSFWDAGSGQAYRPLDYDATAAAGEVTLRTALDWSLNIPAVKVMQFAGVQDVQRMAARLGITNVRGTWGLSTVLGALDVTPYEMVQAYTVFANGGNFVPLHAIDRISDSAGNVLYQYSPPRPVQVLDPRIAFLITSILSDNASRAGDFGGCSPLYLAPYGGPGNTHYTFAGAYSSSQCAYLYTHRFLSPQAWPVAAKTGTAQNFKDDWTIGYTMDYTGAVWVGNNDDTPMQNIDGVSGAAPIWYSSMLYAEEAGNLPRRPFPVPAGVHLAHYCSQGVCTTDWFLDGQTPAPNIGEDGAYPPCVSLLQGGGWQYSQVCQVGLERHLLQNAGAPPGQTQAVGGP
jgi:membrane peptidoglycan carboxypeptidase